MMASIPGGSAWSPDCRSMKKFVNNPDLLMCLGDVIGDRHLLKSLRLTSRAFAAAFERALFRVLKLWYGTRRLLKFLEPSQGQDVAPFLRHVRHLSFHPRTRLVLHLAQPSRFPRREDGDPYQLWELWDKDEVNCYIESFLAGLVSCSMDIFPPLLLTLAEHAHRLTVLDIRCRCNQRYKNVIPSVLCKFRGLKELSLRDIPREWDDYAEAITTVLINSPNMEALRVATFAFDRDIDWNPCCTWLDLSDPCPHALLPAICEKFVRQQRKGEGRPVNGVERTDIPRLKLREVTVDHHSMNRFILDIPDPDGDRQNPLYLEKLTDLQYLERLHIEIPPISQEKIGPGIVRLPKLTPAIAPRLRSLTISPACPRESRRWHKWVLENNFLDYARQVSLGRLEDFDFLDNSRFENLILDWSDRVNPHENIYTLLYLLKLPATTKSLRRLELNTPGDWTKLVPSLKDTVSRLGKLKYFNIHLAEYCPPLCLSWEALKRDKHFRKMVALAEDFFEVQPSLHFVEVNYFLYQVVRWGPGARDFHMVEVLDREREWVAPEDTPWQGPQKDAVPFRVLL